VVRGASMLLVGVCVCGGWSLWCCGFGGFFWLLVVWGLGGCEFEGWMFGWCLLGWWIACVVRWGSILVALGVVLAGDELVFVRWVGCDWRLVGGGDSNGVG